MKVLHVYNVANDAYNLVVAQRKIGIDAHLVIDETHSVFALPNWENVRRTVTDVRSTMRDDNDMWNLPYWIKAIRGGVVGRTISLFRSMRGYDIIQSYSPSSIYTQFMRTPYIIYDSGWLRKLFASKNNQTKLGRSGYAKSKCIIMTNPDMYDMVDVIDYLPRIVFIPFAIPVDRYRPTDQPNNKQLIYFCPSRQNVIVKGTDLMIRAFAAYLNDTKLKPKPALYMTSWGDDVEAMKRLVMKYPEWMHEHFKWLDVMSKPDLISAYQKADVVFDQFVLGSYGTAAPEAMACGRPVIMYLHPGYNKRCYGEVPPVANAWKKNMIYDQCMKLEDVEYRRVLGQQGRKWVETHHDSIKVAKKHKELYKEILT